MTKDAKPERSGVEKLVHEIKELGVTVAIFLPIWLTVMFLGYELRSIPSESMVPTLQVGDRVAVSKFAYGFSKHSVPFGLGRYLPLGDGRVFGSEPERGDVIVFKHPHLNRTMIKRLIGLPGDTIQVRNNRVYLNGNLVKQEPLRRVSYHEARSGRLLLADEIRETLPGGHSYLVHDIRSYPNDTTVTFQVPEGHYFFMGDNRDNSADARKLVGHCPPNEDDVVDRAGCTPDPLEGEPTIGYVPYDNIIGRADTVLFTLNFCGRYESGCPKGRVWKSL
jgi:signal peptidase I